MKCKKCKREIPEYSVYCLFCGVKLVKAAEDISVPKPRKKTNGEYTAQLMVDGERVRVTGKNEADYYRRAKAYKSGLVEIKHSKTLTLTKAIDNYIDKRSEILSPSSIRGYRGIQKNRFQSVMKHDIHSISDWQSLVNEEVKTGCSPKTICNSWRFIGSVLRDNGITPPVIILPQRVANDKPFLEPDEVAEYISDLAGKSCELPALLALESLRQSELLALTWDDIDLAKGTISVRGAMVRNEFNEFVVKDTNKNETSRRTVPIFIPQLRALLESVPEDQRTGRLITQHPATIRRELLEVREGLTLHRLRHSYTSITYALGISEKQAMLWGGWADFGTMRRIYTHLSKAESTEAAAKLLNFYSSPQKT